MMRLLAIALLILGAALVATASAASAEAEEKPSEAAAVAKPAVEDRALTEIQGFIESAKIDQSKPGWKQQLPKPPRLTFADDKTYFWRLETTQGPMRLRLLSDVAPMHVSSTIYLTQLGFYDGLRFHRVIPGFMAQGGDPTGTGRGGPGYRYDGEFDPAVKHDRPGLLSMANAGPGTDGSQFFITFKATPHLNGKHTIFGEVVEGMETLRELEKHASEKLEIRKATIVVE